jgi:hypothetical protein
MARHVHQQKKKLSLPPVRDDPDGLQQQVQYHSNELLLRLREN